MDITSYLLGKQAGGGSSTNLQNNKNVTITSNGTEEINPDTGYDGMKKVTVSTNVTPNLETKSVTITENKITTITPTSGKDGLSSVEVVTNIPTGGEPEKGVIITEWDNDGLPTKVKIKNMQLVDYLLYNSSASNPTLASITEINLQPINITITSINKNAFSTLRNLTTINLLNTITSIGDYAFYDCRSLNISTLPDSVTTIGGMSFYQCYAIKKLSMNGVTTLAGWASSVASFDNCTGLKKIWIGSSITSSGLPRYTFRRCNNLEKIYINLPRATVEAFTDYQYAFMNDTSKTGIIICNDDAGFISKAEFDALVVE